MMHIVGVFFYISLHIFLTRLCPHSHAANQTRVAGLAAEGVFAPGAVGSAAGQHGAAAGAPARLPGRRVSGGAGEGARDLEQATSAAA